MDIFHFQLHWMANKNASFIMICSWASFFSRSLFLSMDAVYSQPIWTFSNPNTHRIVSTEIQKWKALQFTVNVFLLRNKNIHVKFYYWNCKCRYYSAILIGECRQNLIKNVIISAFHFDSSNLIKNSFVCCQWVYLFGNFFFVFFWYTRKSFLNWSFLQWIFGVKNLSYFEMWLFNFMSFPSQFVHCNSFSLVVRLSVTFMCCCWISRSIRNGYTMLIAALWKVN